MAKISARGARELAARNFRRAADSEITYRVVLRSDGAILWRLRTSYVGGRTYRASSGYKLATVSFTPAAMDALMAFPLAERSRRAEMLITHWAGKRGWIPMEGEE